MRLLVLTPEFDGAGGGIITFYRNLLPALARLGVDVRVIEGSAAHAESRRNARIVDGIPVETLELERLQQWLGAFSRYASMPGLRRHLAAAWAMWEQASLGPSFDVIEAADWGFSFVPPVVDGSIPLVVQAHASAGQISVHDPVAGEEGESVVIRLLERALLARPVLQTYSQANATAWTAETGRSVQVIRPAWRGMPARESSEPAGARGLVIGRLQRWKGPHVVCEALQQLGPDAPVIDWVGRDTPWGEKGFMTSQRLAESYPGIWGRMLHLSRPVDAAGVARLQAQALFNLVPSTWDVFNFTAVEAMASGRPTIVSRGAGASELVRDGENGFLFDAGDADGLANAIRRVQSAGPETLAAIGRAGAATIAETLDPDLIAKQRLAAYQTAIDGFRPSPIGGWLGEACRPNTAPTNESAHLEGFPVKLLASHVADRLGRKLGFGR